MPNAVKKPADCPCESGRSYRDCCGPYLSGAAAAPTAEALMRSRYTAYARENLEYVRKTWHPGTCPPDLRLVPGQRWLGLKIKRVEDGGVDDVTGTVEFVARSKRNGRARRLHEISRFEKIDGKWLYKGGEYHGSAS